MAYTTLVKLKQYMPEQTIMQLTDDENVGQICEEIVDDCIDQAQDFIDAYLKGRYPDEMADADVPDLIQDICTKIAAYNLYRRKLVLTLPETISKDYALALKMLSDIQSGKLTPFDSTDEPTIIVGNKASTDRDYTSTVWSTYA